ncbi:natural cytotoxicity triggering receptor 3-like [Protopterus annectens]|uniref:natural cytotoxicity triggering receptor 3-like n=1 Tax=Protopterus annectens TaxID=7888 RepID=UPI001CFC11A1|nr:natural cytotoxicity triggering receptor 3-like [Protopterus annectens]
MENESHDIQVFQILSITANEGEDVLLPCHFYISSAFKFGSYHWYKDSVKRIEVHNESAEFKGRIRKVESSDFINNKNASLLIHGVNISDSGTYYCKVEIPFVGIVSGNGTYLHVASSKAQAVTTLNISAPSCCNTETSQSGLILIGVLLAIYLINRLTGC